MNNRLFTLLCSILLVSVLLNPAHGATGYWQQKVDYRIDVTLNDSLNQLIGFEEMTYYNNAPDTLHYIWFHIWPNAYKDHNTAYAKQALENGSLDFYHSTKEQRGFIDQLDFTINGEPAATEEDHAVIDVIKLLLNEPLRPGDSITITTPFRVKLPYMYSRLGYREQKYSICQWYPKPAVYDDKGWHKMPYLNQGEFYSEFGSFDVNITVPENYVVAATGDLQNPEEKEWLAHREQQTRTFLETPGVYDKYHSFYSVKKVDTIFRRGDDLYRTKWEVPRSSNKTKTLRFIQDNVHDFAWFADKEYYVMSRNIKLPSGREVLGQSYFNGEAEEVQRWYSSSLDHIRHAAYHYSDMVGEYPYNVVTAVTGPMGDYGGMEYPTITVTEFTAIIHEVGHNWFYGILGSNERVIPWMDEGMNVFLEERTKDRVWPDRTAADAAEDWGLPNGVMSMLHFDDHKARKLSETFHLMNVRTRKDQPVSTTSPEFTDFNYFSMIYLKAALAFDYLMAYMGEEQFDKALQRYYEEWKFKHPRPEALRHILEEETGKDLGWFFDQLLGSTLPVDIRMGRVVGKASVASKDYIKFEVHNGRKRRGGTVKGPFPVSAIKDGEVVQTVWYDGFWGTKDLLFPVGDYDLLRVDHYNNLPEANRQNNTLKMRGMFKKVEPLKLQWLAGPEDGNRTQTFFTPIVGWNNYDKLMGGLAFYNSFVPTKSFEYNLAPMYSTNTGNPVGFVRWSKFWYPKRTFSSINLDWAGRSFTNDEVLYQNTYYRSNSILDLTFKNRNMRSKKVTGLKFRHMYLQKEVPAFDWEIKDLKQGTLDFYLAEASFYRKNNRAYDPFRWEIMFQGGRDFAKAMLEVNWHLGFFKKGKGMDVRFFAGGFGWKSDAFGRATPADVRFKMSAVRGAQDYRYDDLFLGRNEFGNEILARQVAVYDGGFRTITPIGDNNEWLTALNVQTDIPIPLPFRLFSDIGAYPDDREEDGFSMIWDAGVILKIIPHTFEVNFPIFMTRSMKDVIELNTETYFERVSFVLKLQNLNLLKEFRKLSF